MILTPGIFPWGTGNGPSSAWSTRFLANGEAVPEGWKSMTDGGMKLTKTLIFQDNDFQDITLNTALEQNYNLSANGGTSTIKYAASMGYSDIEGTSVGTYYNRFNGRANVDFKLRKNLTLTTRMDHSSSKTNTYRVQLMFLTDVSGLLLRLRFIWKMAHTGTGRIQHSPICDGIMMCTFGQ